jgi:5S rRNA maturation endonuclease (ribonuclease M5)
MTGRGTVKTELLKSYAEQIPGGVQWSGNGEGKIHCPLGTHEDRNPSCSINYEKNTFYCHACQESGTLGGLLHRIGIEFPKGDGGFDAIYDYTDENGKLSYQVCRRCKRGKKDFPVRRPDGKGGWLWGLRGSGIQQTLYRLQEIKKSIAEHTPVFVVEGEKDVERLRLEGFTATTSPGGAGKWRQQYVKYLKGASVILAGDSDKPGQAHIRKIARSLVGVASRVRMLNLGYEITEDHGKDISDWLKEHSKEELIELCKHTPDYRFPEEPEGVKRKLEVVTIADIKQSPPVSWLIEDVLFDRTLSILGGYTGFGKSMVALAMAHSIADGFPLFGKYRVHRQGPVLFVDEENSHSDLKDRFLKMGIEDNTPIYWISFANIWLDDSESFGMHR